jgi:multisubunit Na+/H+ antiporter MnhB subunit
MLPRTAVAVAVLGLDAVGGGLPAWSVAAITTVMLAILCAVESRTAEDPAVG